MQGFFFKQEEKPVKQQTRKRKSKSPPKKLGCESCGLYKNCITPKMKPTGKNKKNVLIIAEAPGKLEDEKGIQLIGKAGHTLRKSLKKINIDLDKDCIKTNACICRPPGNKTPTDQQINVCRHNLFKTIEEHKPDKIIALGKVAMQGLLGHRTSIGAIERWVGRQIPDQELNTWIFPNYHPSYILRDKRNFVLHKKFEENLEIAFSWKEDFPVIPKIEIIKEVHGAKIYLESILSLIPKAIAIDYETTGKKPYAEGHKILSIGISDGYKHMAFPIFYDDPEFMKLLRKVLQNKKIKKIAQNMKYEDIWTRIILGYNIQGWVWDTQTAAHILDNRSKTTNLDFQVYINFGELNYGEEIEPFKQSDSSNEKNKMESVPLNQLLKYNGKDSAYTYMLYEKQIAQFGLVSGLSQAYDLFHEGNLELSRIETNGIFMDLEYYKKANIHLERRINRMLDKIKETKEAKKYEKTFDKSFNPGSHPQLKDLLFNILGYKSEKKTAKGAYSTNEESLSKIGTPFTELLVKHGKLGKIKGTYVKNFIEETVNNYMHPSFNLNIARTYRSTGTDPNFQNIPVRDKEAQKITRSGIIPRPGRQILEPDYSQIEVCMAACNNKDPNMIKYIETGGDMHKDIAKEIFKKKEVTKQERYLAKNQFVFPQFYGSWYEQCATNIWRNRDLEEQTKIGLRDNFSTYKKFENHVQDVEDNMWNKRFPVYNEWREKIWHDYQKTGYIDMLTGFKCTKIMKRKEVLNYPIQGIAFHCLLWSLIQLNRYLRKERFDSLIIGQIHDSIVMDVVPDELGDLMPVIKRIMCEDIREAWPWIIVPLSIEAELTDVDKSWYTKEEVEI